MRITARARHLRCVAIGRSRSTISSGFIRRLRRIKAEFDQGRAAIIENVGYPNPNRSHFRSMEIWHTGEDAEGKREVNGWLGRYFDAQCRGSDPHRTAPTGELGVSFGKLMPQSFRNTANVGIALDDPETFQWNPSGETLGLAKAQEAIFAKLNQPASGAPAGNMRTIESLGGITGQEPETLDFLRHTAMNAVVAGDDLRYTKGNWELRRFLSPMIKRKR